MAHISHLPVKMSGHCQKCHDATNYAAITEPVSPTDKYCGYNHRIILSNDTLMIMPQNS